MKLIKKKTATEKRRELQNLSESSRKKHRNRRITIAVIVALVILVFSLSIKNIISLKLEQSDLKKQQSELTTQRDELKAKVKNINNPEYIQEEARKKLKLVAPDEILFIFKDSKDNAEDNGKDKN